MSVSSENKHTQKIPSHRGWWRWITAFSLGESYKEGGYGNKVKVQLEQCLMQEEKIRRILTLTFSLLYLSTEQ
jgi:hypothetical protein